MFEKIRDWWFRGEKVGGDSDAKGVLPYWVLSKLFELVPLAIFLTCGFFFWYFLAGDTLGQAWVDYLVLVGNVWAWISHFFSW